jgi:ATP-dependent Clp protease ATP-binding subunit ClpC
MFERYTERARRIVFFSRYEASQFGSPYIEPEHFLLGLLRERSSLGDLLPASLTLDAARNELEAMFPVREKTSTSVDLPLAHETKRILAYGAEEAERLNHPNIGPRHLLLGLLSEDTLASAMLRKHGLTLEEVRKKIVQSDPMAATGADYHEAVNVLRQKFTSISRGLKPDVEPAAVYVLRPRK